jgi:hypothetical protein
MDGTDALIVAGALLMRVLVGLSPYSGEFCARGLAKKQTFRAADESRADAPAPPCT